MRVRSQIRLLRLAIIACLLGSVALILWCALNPVEAESEALQRTAKSTDAIARIPLPEIGSFENLFGKRFQGPAPPKKVEVVDKPKQVQPKVVWPKISLQCVFWGTKSKLAVIRQAERSFACKAGESVEGVLIEDIKMNHIIASYKGQRRKITTENQQIDLVIEALGGNE